MFVKFENPFVFNANGHTFIEIQKQLNKAISDAKENGYDGVILEDEGEYTYIAFEPSQIKSVNNQGTFDSKNPNIYYQKDEAYSDKGKYLNNNQTALKNFYDVHKNFAEKEPEQYNGKKTIKDLLSYLGSINNKVANIKSPVENITITRGNARHLLKENEKERSNYINRFIRTLQAPNLIIESIENGKAYNYYIKSFLGEDDKISGHVQIIKKCIDGNFYVTNHHLKNSKLTKALKNGQIIYDLSDLSAVQNAPDNTIITDNANNFNPRTLFQSAYHGTKVRGLENTGFDLSYAKTGEGALAHGWGVYTAKDKDVSEGYRKGVTKSKNFTYEYDGKSLEETDFSKITSETLHWLEAFGKEKAIEIAEMDITYAKEWEEKNKDKQSEKTLNGNRKYIKEKQKDLELLEKLDEDKFVMTAGQLYKVDIPETNEMLDEDLILDEQPKNVQKAIETLLEENPYFRDAFYVLRHQRYFSVNFFDLFESKQIIDDFRTELYEQQAIRKKVKYPQMSTSAYMKGLYQLYNFFEYKYNGVNNFINL